jgi:NTP pyrophosphatase (non-canonical NTP hydrolase)
MKDETTTIKELRDKVNEFRKKRGWRDDPKDMALSLVLEAAEVLEHFQWMSGEEVAKEARLMGPIGDELSDVLWWVLAMSERMGIDLASAFEKKMQTNEKKWPESEFGADKSREEKRRSYYRLKAKYRGGHPLAEEE